MNRPAFSLDDSIPYLIYRISTKANQNIHGKLRPVGITLTQWRLLSSLKSRGKCTVGDLAACTVMQHAVVSRNLSEMETAGLVSREQSVGDQRFVFIDLTRKGEAEFERAHAIAQEHLGEFLEGFSSAETETFRALLQRIQRNVRATP